MAFRRPQMFDIPPDTDAIHLIEVINDRLRRLTTAVSEGAVTNIIQGGGGAAGPRDTAFYVYGIGMQAGDTVSAPVKLFSGQSAPMLLIAASFDDPPAINDLVIAIEKSSNNRASWSTLLDSQLTIPVANEGVIYHSDWVGGASVAYGDLIRMRVVSTGPGAGNGAVVVFYQ